MPPVVAIPHSSQARQRFETRKAWMLAYGWTYYPDRDLFAENVSLLYPPFSGAKTVTFAPRQRKVYGREVAEVPEQAWQAYLLGQTDAWAIVDAMIGHPFLQKAPSDPLYDPNSFAVDANGGHYRPVR